MSKPKIIVYDLDGVIVDSSERHTKYIDVDADCCGNREKFLESIYKFESTVEGDKPINSGISLVMSLLNSNQPCIPIAVTGRSERSRNLTLSFLKNNTPIPVSNDTLFMRPIDGHNPDTVAYKKKVVSKLLEEYDILYAIDDHQHICSIYKQLGVPTLHFCLGGMNCLLITKEEEMAYRIE